MLTSNSSLAEQRRMTGCRTHKKIYKTRKGLSGKRTDYSVASTAQTTPIKDQASEGAPTDLSDQFLDFTSTSVRQLDFSQ